MSNCGCELDRCCRLFSDLGRAQPNQLGQTLELLSRQIAQFDREPDNAGNHIRSVGDHLQPADRADLSAWFRVHDVAHGDRQMRSCEQCILPIRHRRRAGVIRKAGNGHFVPINCDDALDNTNGNILAFERAALLNMELEVTMVRASRSDRLRNAIGVAADLAYRIGASHPVPDLVHV